MKRAAIYRRVSTAEQADSRLGLDSQLSLAVEAMRREVFGDDHVALIFDAEIGVFTDAGVSGSVPLALRKDGRRLTEAIEAGEIGIVVALTQDRLFRSLLDALATLEHWQELGVRVLLVDGGFLDTDDDDRWMAMAMRGLFAEMERRSARKRTKRALRAAAENGKRLGGVPYGSRTAAHFVDGRKVDGGVHVPVADEQAVIGRIRALRPGRTFREVAAELNSQSVPAPRGDRWHGETVRRVLGRAS